jgi:hypothetical protein
MTTRERAERSSAILAVLGVAMLTVACGDRDLPASLPPAAAVPQTVPAPAGSSREPMSRTASWWHACATGCGAGRL